MNAIRICTTAAWLACAATTAGAVTAAAKPASAASAVPHRKPSLAAMASRQLRTENVPSTKTEPIDAQAQAGAAKTPRLKVERQNLKGPDAARALAQQHNASTYDRDIATGDKDHTQQLANVKVTVKK